MSRASTCRCLFRTRARFQAWIAFACSLQQVASIAAASGGPSEPTRPKMQGTWIRSSVSNARNIVFFHCDEMDGRIVDPRHPISRVTRKPNLEAMMANGVNFVGAYTNNPICAPSRASMFTGRRTSSIEAWSNVKPLTADVSEWPPTKPDPNCIVVGLGAERCLELGRRQNVSSTINSAIAALGYNVALYGKMDTGGGPSMNPPKTRATGYHDTGRWDIGGHPMQYYPGDVLHSWAMGANISKPTLAPLDTPNEWIDLNRIYYADDWGVVEDCVEFLRSYRKGDQPFFLYCSVLNPHPPYFSNSTWEDYIDKLELEHSLDWTEKTQLSPSRMHPADVYSMHATGVPDHINRTLERDLAIGYHGACAMADAMLGRVRAALQASQAAKSTFLVFASDHGELHLEHRLVEKFSMYEASARVPLLVEGPGVPHNQLVGDFVTLIDLFPTFLDMAGAAALPDASLQGYSLAPFLGITPQRSDYDKTSKRPDFAISEYTAEQANTPQFMIRQGDFKYIAYGTEAPFQGYRSQLFNVTADPWEITNLAEHPDMASIAAALDRRLRSAVEYPEVVKRLAVENRENVRRWMAAYPEQEWRSMVKSAYYAGDDGDIEKLVRWLEEKGEFAPALTVVDASVVV